MIESNGQHLVNIDCVKYVGSIWLLSIHTNLMLRPIMYYKEDDVVPQIPIRSDRGIDTSTLSYDVVVVIDTGHQSVRFVQIMRWWSFNLGH